MALLLCTCACKRHPAERQEVFRPGGKAPVLELTDLSGNRVTLEDYRGKVVLINLWATWCAPCVAEMPALERLSQKLKDRGLVVLAINVEPESKKAAVLEFVKKYKLSLPVLLDPKFSAATRYATTGFPESFFLDREGRFLEFSDPTTGKNALRIVSDRPWDSPEFIESIGKLLPQAGG